MLSRNSEKFLKYLTQFLFLSYLVKYLHLQQRFLTLITVESISLRIKGRFREKSPRQAFRQISREIMSFYLISITVLRNNYYESYLNKNNSWKNNFYILVFKSKYLFYNSI